MPREGYQKLASDDSKKKECLISEVYEEKKLSESTEASAKVKSGLLKYLHELLPHHPILKAVIAKHKNDSPDNVKPLLDDYRIARNQLVAVKNEIEEKRNVEVEKMMSDQKKWTSFVFCWAGVLTCFSNPCFGASLIGTGVGAAAFTKFQESRDEHHEAVNDIRMIDEAIPKLEAILQKQNPVSVATAPVAMFSQNNAKGDVKATNTSSVQMQRR